ncbi:MAG: transposase, partial [Thermoplasmatales archaeon]
MLKTLQIKLLPNDEQKQILTDTFIAFNKACNYVSKIAWEKKLFNKILLHRVVYRDIRNK